MAQNMVNPGEKTKEQRIQAREEALRGALPQRLAFQRLFGKQFILPKRTLRQAAGPSDMPRDNEQRPTLSPLPRCQLRLSGI